MSQNVKVKWTGADATRVRLIPNGEKVEIKVGQTFEVSEKIAEALNFYSRQFVINPTTAQKEPRIEKGVIAKSKIKRG